MKHIRYWLNGIYYFLIRLFTGGIFAYAGFSKLMEPAANFRAVLAQYGVIPEAAVDMIALILPWAEWILGVFILTGYAPRMSSAAIGILSAGFAAVLLMSGKLWGTALPDCGCFGEGGLQLSVRQIFLIDLTNILFAAFLFFRHNHPLSLDAFLRRPS